MNGGTAVVRQPAQRHGADLAADIVHHGGDLHRQLSRQHADVNGGYADIALGVNDLIGEAVVAAVVRVRYIGEGAIVTAR